MARFRGVWDRFRGDSALAFAMAGGHNERRPASDELWTNPIRTWSVREERKFMMEGYTCTLSDDLTRFEVIWGETGVLVGTLTKKEEPK